MMKITNLKNTPTREILFIEATNENPLPDGKHSLLGKKGLLNRVIKAHLPFLPTSGGVGDLGFVIITPQKEYFYAFDYSKDLPNWKNQIINGAAILGIQIGQIVGETFHILHGNRYPLADCEFEAFHFYSKDNTGKLKLNPNRTALNKTDVLLK